MRIVMAIAVLFLALQAVAQDRCKRLRLYAFERSTLPGVLLQQVHESGRIDTGRVNASITYHLFADLPKAKNLRIEGVFVKGVFHNTKQSVVQNIPVVIGKTPVANRERADTLVHKVSGTLIRLDPDQQAQYSFTEKTRKLTKENEFVLLFSIGKRKYYSEVAQIKKLEPLALQ